MENFLKEKKFLVFTNKNLLEKYNEIKKEILLENTKETKDVYR